VPLLALADQCQLCPATSKPDAMFRVRRAESTRWRERPRESMVWGSSLLGVYVIFVGGAWWAAAGYGWAALTGHVNPAGDRARWESALVALVALAVAAATTWIACTRVGLCARRRKRRPTRSPKPRRDGATPALCRCRS
jgi:hypothetical protein